MTRWMPGPSTSRPSGARSARGRSVPRRSDPFKTELVARLGELGWFVNEFGIADVVMHIAIAADRTARDRPLDAVGAEGAAARDRPTQTQVAAIIADLSERHLEVHLGSADLQHLATLVLTRVVAPDGLEGAASTTAPSTLDPEVEAAVHDVVTAAAEEFLVDIAHDDFVARLALHVQNLLHRAREQAWSRNPLTRSLKSTYPMIFEVAVFIASRLQQRLGHPAARRRDRLHRDARRRPPRAQPPCRPAADRDHRVPRLLRPARAAALERRPLARAGDRGRRRRDARRSGLGVDGHRPRAHDHRSARDERADRPHPAVPDRHRRRAGAGGRGPHPPLATTGATARRARALLRAVGLRTGARRRGRLGRGGRDPLDSERCSWSAASSTPSTSSARSNASGSRPPRSPMPWPCRMRWR